VGRGPCSTAAPWPAAASGCWAHRKLQPGMPSHHRDIQPGPLPHPFAAAPRLHSLRAPAPPPPSPRPLAGSWPSTRSRRTATASWRCCSRPR
jgi:hypothetical protein